MTGRILLILIGAMALIVTILVAVRGLRGDAIVLPQSDAPSGDAPHMMPADPRRSGMTVAQSPAPIPQRALVAPAPSLVGLDETTQHESLIVVEGQGQVDGSSVAQSLSRSLRGTLRSAPVGVVAAVLDEQAHIRLTMDAGVQPAPYSGSLDGQTLGTFLSDYAHERGLQIIVTPERVHLRRLP